MDLSKPCVDLSEEYDRKIKETEKYIEQLDKDYGFSKQNAQSITSDNKSMKPKQKQSNSISNRTVNYLHCDDDEPEQPSLKRPTPIPCTNYLNKPQDVPRYKNLVSIEVEKPKNIKNNPEISEKWAQVFAKKPDIMHFYQKEEFSPLYFDKRDFQTNIHLHKENEVFNNYMDSFALKNI